MGINGPVVLIPNVETAVSSIERLWAYLTLKQILEQREQEDNKTGPTQEALRIALKYSFVSDVSSLVVVKPNQTDTVETEDGCRSEKCIRATNRKCRHFRHHIYYFDIYFDNKNCQIRNNLSKPNHLSRNKPLLVKTHIFL